MTNINSFIQIRGQIGKCGDVRAFLGFASARLLYSLSFADVLNEDTGEGYQRPRNAAHSRSFRLYIKQPKASTIPLTFNLRKEPSNRWKLKCLPHGRAILFLTHGIKSLAQVDCQHRLGELAEEDIQLAFMAYLGLDLRTEMALFTIINSKAKGLSSSLTDYHESNLLNDLAKEAPHLYISRKLNEDINSPWYRMIRYGGETNSGLRRRTSLRMMQKTVLRLIQRVPKSLDLEVDELYDLILLFWNTVKSVFSNEWDDQRHSLLTKGVGLYSLMLLLSDLIRSAPAHESWESFLYKTLFKLKSKVDWTTSGPFSNIGGHKGVNQAHTIIKTAAGL